MVTIHEAVYVLPVFNLIAAKMARTRGSPCGLELKCTKYQKAPAPANTFSLAGIGHRKSKKRKQGSIVLQFPFVDSWKLAPSQVFVLGSFLSESPRRKSSCIFQILGVDGILPVFLYCYNYFISFLIASNGFLVLCALGTGHHFLFYSSFAKQSEGGGLQKKPLHANCISLRALISQQQDWLFPLPAESSSSLFVF